MNIPARIVITTVLACLPAPAAAQDPDRLRDLDRNLSRAADLLERRFEARLEAQVEVREQARERRQAAERRREERVRQRLEIVRQRLSAARQGPVLTEQVSRTVRLGREGFLDLTNVIGDIVITGGGGDEVRIEAVKRVWNQNQTEAKALLEALQVEITERTGQVDVRTVIPDRRRAVSTSVDYTIAVPSNTGIVVKGVSGDMRITNIKGELRAESVNGDVSLSLVSQLRSLKSVSGNIHIDNAEGTDLTASTVNGTITARNMKVRAIDLTSIGGDVRFTDVESDRVRLRSLDGDIEYAGRLARGGRYDLQSHSGDVRVTPSNPDGFEVEAGTFQGNVRSDFAVTLSLGRAGSRPGTGGARMIRGSFGDGGANLILRSFNGDIVITRR